MAKYVTDVHTDFDVADKNSIMQSGLLAGENANNMHFDSADDASVFFARELDYVKGKSYDVQYPELTGLELFPQSHDADPGATTYTYYTYEKNGAAKIVSNYATDLPRVDVDGKPTTAVIKSVADSYGYSVQEMRSSRMAGKSLDRRKAESARYQIDRKLNEIIWAGDPANNLNGILTSGNDIPLYTLPENAAGDSTAWKDKSAEEIMADVRGMLMAMAKATKNVERPDTLVLPDDVFIDISNRQIPNTGYSVLRFIKENALSLKEIISASELNSDSVETNPYAAASNGQGVALLFKNDPNKLSVEMPMPFMQYPVQAKGLGFEVPCEARTAGVILYYPYSLLIAVGV